MEIQKIFSEQGGEDKIYSVLLSESEYEIYQKEFGLFSSGVDIYEFLDLARDCNYPVKVEGLIGRCYKCESTWAVFKKEHGRLKSSTTQKIKNILSNLSENLKPELKKARSGNPNDFELHLVYLEYDNQGNLNIGVDLEAKKSMGKIKRGDHLSFSLFVE